MNLLKEMIEIPAVSGNEGELRSRIMAEIKGYCDEMNVDTMGNLIAHKKGPEGAPKFMLSAHMDEIGVIVTFADDNGYLRFANLGYLDKEYMTSNIVRFRNGEKGVLCLEHEVEPAKRTMSSFYIDIGAKDKEEAARRVPVGEVGVMEGSLLEIGSRYVAKSLDDKVGCYVLIETMKRLKAQKYDCYFVFSVQEEVGCRGAKTAAYSVEADYGLAVDVTDTGDEKGAKPMAVSLGKGAAVKVRDRSVICHRKMVDYLVDTASKNKIAYQMEVLDIGGTDAGEIHLSRRGVVTGGVSVPTRYIHTPSEMCDKEDVEACILLITAALEREIC